VGLVSTSNLGAITLNESITDITASDNGVVVGLDLDAQFVLCTGTCAFAFDGVCDDGGPGAAFVECDLGTDCSDCGQTTVNLQGTQSITYKLFGVDRIDFRRSSAVAFPGTVVSSDKECQGVLVP